MSHTKQPSRALVLADIECIHNRLDGVMSDNTLPSDVRDAIDGLRIALDSGDLSANTVAEIFNALDPQ